MIFFSNSFLVIGLYLLFHNSLGECRLPRKTEILLYFAYYMIRSTLFSIWYYPLLHEILDLSYVILAIPYTREIADRIYISFMCTVTTMALKTIIYYSCLLSGIAHSAEISLFGAHLFFLVFSLAFPKILFGKSVTKKGLSNLIVITAFINICLIFAIFFYSFPEKSYVIIAFLLLLTNLATLYIFFGLEEYYANESRENMLNQQNIAYQNQIRIMQNSQATLGKFRHDIKNHMLVLSASMMDEGDDFVQKYIRDIEDYLKNTEEYVHTGNMELDSFLNYKLSTLASLGAEIDTSVVIPEQLDFSSFDLNVILGNLIDNAYEALAVSTQKKFSFAMRFERQLLFISVRNTFDGNIIMKNGQYLSTKDDTLHHGIGLKNVKRMVEKYDGEIHINDKNNQFHVSIILW